MEFTKEFKEREDLLTKLAERGLAIPDRDAAIDFLTRVGYFRSGAYRYVLRQLLPPNEIDERLRQYRSNEYLPGASFTHVMKLEAFDSKLSRVCLEGLLDFEKYPQQPVPIWAVTEVVSFGKLPFLFDLMQTQDARVVARMFGFAHPRVFGAVLRMMVDFRNTCAHGSRLFNRAFKRSLSIKSHEAEGDLLAHLLQPDYTNTPKPSQRLYIYAATLAFMLRSHSAGSLWHLTFRTQVRKFDLALLGPDGRQLIRPDVSMGFPSGWEELELWKQ